MDRRTFLLILTKSRDRQLVLTESGDGQTSDLRAAPVNNQYEKTKSTSTAPQGAQYISFFMFSFFIFSGPGEQISLNGAQIPLHGVELWPQQLSRGADFWLTPRHTVDGKKKYDRAPKKGLMGIRRMCPLLFLQKMFSGLLQVEKDQA